MSSFNCVVFVPCVQVLCSIVWHGVHRYNVGVRSRTCIGVGFVVWCIQCRSRIGRQY